MNPVIENYIELVIAHDQLVDFGNEGEIQALRLKIDIALEKIKQGTSGIKKEFYALLSHSNLVVRRWVAYELLGTLEQRAIEVLEELKKLEDKNIYSVSPSEVILNCWRKGLFSVESWEVD